MKQSTFRTMAVIMMILATLQVTPAKTAQLDQSSVVSPEVITALQGSETVRVIINLNAPDNSAMSMNDRMATVQSLQDSVLSGLSDTDFTLERRFQIVPALAGEINSASLEALSQNSNVASVELDQPVEAHDTASLSALQATTVHSSYGITGLGVTVAVLDTGIDVDNDDFEDRIIAQHCFTKGNCQKNKKGDAERDESGYADDLNGHGTNVAGIVASNGAEGSETKGFAPQANLVSVRVMDEDGAGRTSDWVAGLEWVYTNTVLSAVPVDVVNMSFGSDSTYTGVCDSNYASAANMISLLNSIGVTVFASTGNNGKFNSIAAPACLSHVIAVGATYDGNIGNSHWEEFYNTFGCVDTSSGINKITCFTNRSSLMDLLAPGAIIASSQMGGGVSKYSGTSQAAAVGSGVAALMLEVNPNLTPEAIETALQNSGISIEDSKSGLTFKRVDALKAVQSQTSTIIAGNTVGLVGNTYTFTAVVNPFSISVPITYTWVVDGYATYVSTTPSINTASYIFSTAGTKQINLTVTNSGGSFTDSLSIKIFTALPNKIYMPVSLQN